MTKFAAGQVEQVREESAQPSLSLDDFSSEENPSGGFSLGEFRQEILWDYDEIPIRYLMDKYQEWLEENQYVRLMDQENPSRKKYVKVTKRGNSVYAWRVRKKLEEKTAFMDSDGFAANMLRKKAKGHGWETNCLFVTLTWRANSVVTDDGGVKVQKVLKGGQRFAWENAEYFYNKFITNFRRKFGESWVVKTVESTAKGFVHFHLLIVCKEPFTCFSHYSDKEKKSIWRVEEKKEIAKLWCAFVDVRVPVSVKSVKRYMFKDMMKSLTRKVKKGKDVLTLALSWLFRKQSFSISGKSVLNYLIPKDVTQSDFSEYVDDGEEIDWVFDGVYLLSFKKGVPPPFKFEIIEE